MTFRVRDLESKNGTYVNGQRIDKAGALLVDGDEITIGDTTLRVEIEMPGGSTIGGP
jgi:eukaryotic-like serine/threonine-protein kinase